MTQGTTVKVLTGEHKGATGVVTRKLAQHMALNGAFVVWVNGTAVVYGPLNLQEVG